METFRICEPNGCVADLSRMVRDLGNLLEQLTSSPVRFTENELQAMLSDKNSRLFLLFLGEKIVGMLTLARYRTPTGVKIWIEDVAVDRNFRGRKLGRLLVEHAIKKARAWGPGSLMLTSNPSRIAANRLYSSAGFTLKPTNVYKMDLRETTAGLPASPPETEIQ